MTPSANATQRTAIWLVLVLVALATPSFAADRTVEDAEVRWVDQALRAGFPIIAQIQIGTIVFTAILLPADESTPQPNDAPVADKDEDEDGGKNGVILEDGAPF